MTKNVRILIFILAAGLLALLPISCSTPTPSTWKDVAATVSSEADLLAMISTEQATKLTGDDNLAVSAIRELGGDEAKRVLLFTGDNNTLIVTTPVVNVDKYDEVTKDWHDAKIGDSDARARVSGNSAVISNGSQLWVTLNINKVDDAAGYVEHAIRDAKEHDLATNQDLYSRLFDNNAANVGVAVIRHDEKRFIAKISADNNGYDITMSALDKAMAETTLTDALAPMNARFPEYDCSLLAVLGLKPGAITKFASEFIAPRLSLMGRAMLSYGLGAIGDAMGPFIIAVSSTEPQTISISFTSPNVEQTISHIKSLLNKVDIAMTVTKDGSTVSISGEAPSVPVHGVATLPEAPNNLTAYITARVDHSVFSNILGDIDNDIDVTITADPYRLKAHIAPAN